MVYTGKVAVDRGAAEHYHRTRDWTRDCQYFVRSRFGIGGLYGTAAIAWRNTNHRHTSWPPPAGVPVWFNGPTYFGHVALSIGDGTCWTNDYVRRGYIDRVGILTLSRGWGAPYLGWSEDINEQRIYTGFPVIDLSNVVYAVKHGTKIKNGKPLKRALAAEVGQGIMVLSNRTLGTGFRRQYKKLQIKWYGSGDGIPGTRSLQRLCERHSLDFRY